MTHRHNPNLIEARDISLRGQDGSEIVRPTTLTLPKGVVSITGPSGAGKTSLAVVLHGLVRPSTGEVSHVGVNPENPFINRPVVAAGRLRRIMNAWRLESPEEEGRKGYRARYLGYITQNPHLRPNLTALENITLPHRARGTRVEDAYLRRLADQLDIASRLDHYPATLSGGEQQRVAIVAALVHRPELVTADEPTSALDVGHSETTFTLMREISEQEGTSFVIVSHNPRLAHYADSQIEMQDGQVIRSGLPAVA